MKRKQFSFYRSFWEGIRGLPDTDRLSALEGIIAYALDGEEQALTREAERIFIMARPTLEASRRKAKQGQLGGRPPKITHSEKAKAAKAEGKQAESKKESEEEIEKEIEIEIEGEIENECFYTDPEPPEAPARRFVPPTTEQVRAYCEERGNGIDPELFTSFYISKGWRVGKSPMKNWQAAVRTWECQARKERQEQRERSGRSEDWRFEDL